MHLWWWYGRPHTTATNARPSSYTAAFHKISTAKTHMPTSATRSRGARVWSNINYALNVRRAKPTRGGRTLTTASTTSGASYARSGLSVCSGSVYARCSASARMSRVSRECPIVFLRLWLLGPYIFAFYRAAMKEEIRASWVTVIVAPRSVS